MKIRLLVLGILLTFSAQAFAQGDAKAQEVLKKARAAIGKEDKLKALQNVVAEGTLKRTMGQMNVESQLELVMAMPDKIYRATTSAGFGGGGGMATTFVEVLNGGTTWNERLGGGGGPGGGPGGGGQGGGRGGGGAGMGFGGGGVLSPEQMERNRRNDLARVMLGWFLIAPTGLNAEYAHMGEAKAPDGQVADIIGVKDAGGLIARLYIDRQSGQLLMLSYKDKDMMSIFRGMGGGPGGGRGPGGGQPGGQGQGGQGGQRGPGGLSREEFDKLPQAEKDKLQAEQRARNEARQAEMKAAYEKAPEVDYQWSFAEYKEFNGLNLPTVLTKAVGGNPNEEWVISKFKFNEKSVKPDKFEKKK
jgi:hypothetical protein